MHLVQHVCISRMVPTSDTKNTGKTCKHETIKSCVRCMQDNKNANLITTCAISFVKTLCFSLVLLPRWIPINSVHDIRQCLYAKCPTQKSTDWQRKFAKVTFGNSGSLFSFVPFMPILSFLPLLSFSPLLVFFPLLRISPCR